METIEIVTKKHKICELYRLNFNKHKKFEISFNISFFFFSSRFR